MTEGRNHAQLVLEKVKFSSETPKPGNAVSRTYINMFGAWVVGWFGLSSNASTSQKSTEGEDLNQRKVATEIENGNITLVVGCSHKSLNRGKARDIVAALQRPLCSSVENEVGRQTSTKGHVSMGTNI